MTMTILTIAAITTIIGAAGFFAIFSLVLGEMEDKGMM